MYIYESKVDWNSIQSGLAFQKLDANTYWSYFTWGLEFFMILSVSYV
jgi:hypothetical protein